MSLKATRIKYGLSQSEAASVVGVPVRTFRRYELDEQYGSSFKRAMFINLLKDKYEITEEKGLLTIEKIKQLVSELFDNEYPGLINFCYLFGSYAKGLAKESSDVDLYISSSLFSIILLFSFIFSSIFFFLLLFTIVFSSNSSIKIASRYLPLFLSK